MTTACFTAYRAAVVHAPGGWRGGLRAHEDALVVVRDADGVIAHVEGDVAGSGVLEDEEHGRLRTRLVDGGWLRASDGLRLRHVAFRAGSILMPGFIDVHNHAPQYDYTGTATDLPLMQWLETYTFPAEARMKDAALAKDAYSRCVRRLLRCGTTTAVFFGSIHAEATRVLALECARQGLRAMVGKVCMDRNSPDGYCETTSESLRAVEELIQWCEEEELPPRVQMAITPRFVPTCSRELLSGLGEIAKRHGDKVLVQSHIAESDDMVAFVEALHPEQPRDAEIFDREGLLTSRSIFAHGTHLTTSELDLMHRRGASIAHCPLSNFHFADRELHVVRTIEMGAKVGLGSDVAGGISPFMLQAMRAAVLASKSIAHAERERLRREGDVDERALVTAAEHNAITFKEAFFLATSGAADAIGLKDKVGTLEAGKYFDAIVVDAGRSNTVFDVEDVGVGTLLSRFEKWVNLGEQANIDRVYVAGRDVTRRGTRLNR